MPLRRLAGIVIELALAFACAGAVVLFVYEPVQVEGDSMQPRLDNNERIFINKFVFSFAPIQRGDVVVFRYPRDPSLDFIKRVIGLPGDRIRIAAGRVYVNGVPLAEPYVPPAFNDWWDDYPATVVPAGKYFVLGDHRDSSNDSRDWGFLDRRDIFGKAVLVYWPLPDLGLVH